MAEARSWASSPAARAKMQANRSKGTKPEMALRRELHRRGMRYFVHKRPLKHLRRTPDILFPRQKVAVFVDGCFWHGCPIHHTASKTHAEFWAEKVRRNRERDSDTDRRLAEAGWTSVRIWEHDNVTQAADTIAEVLGR